MILPLKSILLALCLVPGIYIQHVVLSDVRLRGETDSMLFSKEAFKKFHKCFCDDQPETCAGSLILQHGTPHTIPNRGRENMDELREAYKMYTKCYSEENSHFSNSSLQTVCYKYLATCDGIKLCIPFDCLRRWSTIHAERRDDSIGNTCQIECPQSGLSIYTKSNQNFMHVLTDGIKNKYLSGNKNHKRRMLPKAQEEDKNHQRLTNNVVLLVAVGLALAISALGCLGAGCHLFKKRQRTAHNIARSHVSNGDSEYVQFPTSGETSRLGAQQKTNVTRYCFDPTSAPKAPLPITAGSIQKGRRSGHSTSGLSHLNNGMNEEEGDFVNTKTLIDNGLVIPIGVRTGQSNYHTGATAKKPGAYSQVEINQGDHFSQKTDVQFNKNLHRMVDQPKSTQEYSQSDNNIKFQSNVLKPCVISIDPFKREQENIVSDPSVMKTYAKLHERMKRRLNDYNTLVKGEDEKLKHRDRLDYPSTTGVNTREHESDRSQEDQIAGTSDFTNSWIANEVSREGGFKGFVAAENSSYDSSSDSGVYINTNCEDLQHARIKGLLVRNKTTNSPDLHLHRTAVGNSETDLGVVTTVSCYTDPSSDEALFVDFENGDVTSDSSDEDDVYFNTASDEVISLKQREPSPRTNKCGDMCHGIKVMKTNKASEKNQSVDNVDIFENAENVETTTIHTNNDFYDDFYFDMSLNVNAKEVHGDNNIGFDHGVDFHYSDDIYNNTSRDASSKKLSEENEEAKNEMRSKSRNCGEFYSFYHANGQSFAGKDEGVCMTNSVVGKGEEVCMTNKMNHFNHQGFKVSTEDEQFVNTCSQNDYPLDNSWTVDQKTSFVSTQVIKRDIVENVHRYDAEDNEVVSDLHDDIYYYDVSKFQHGSLLPESFQDGNAAGGDNDFLHEHEEISLGDYGSEDGSSNYDSGSRDFGGACAREDDDENVDSDGDEYINIGYDNYKDSVHDERHLCQLGVTATVRDGHEIGQTMFLSVQHSDSGHFTDTDKPSQLLADSGERSIRNESRKHSYFQLERDY